MSLSSRQPVIIALIVASAYFMENLDATVIATTALICGFVAAVLAIRHFGRAEHPLIDLSPWRIPTFRVTLDGGSLYVVSVSVSPFLLPLLFQLGFGLNAFAAGLLVLAYAAGNLGMKTVTTPIVSALVLFSVLYFIGIEPDAGREVSGHTRIAPR
ncbi:hypothetical protein [Paraburkholderia madseniana]|uniref:hypothetical protein n=1 Tax=Paraburkholderia madseniana TaxID=2599607 RepID=UPI001F4348D9|nr:hypothetical protein [Paraburkholderia madseniana]